MDNDSNRCLKISSPVPLKGRGATFNPDNRFRRRAREPVDDGWSPAQDIEDDDLPPTSLAAASAEAIIKTGTTTLALGQRVIYSLSGEPGTVTGAGIFVYIAIKGATSGKYYAVCQVGSTVSGYFEVPQAEKLNVVWRNSDATNAHVMSAHWTAMGV